MSKLNKITARALRRRAQRFNENNPERAIVVPDKITTEYQYRTLSTRLDKAVKLSTTNSKIKDLVDKELQTRIRSLRDITEVTPLKYKEYKTQKAADKELDRIRSLRKEQIKFKAAQERFIKATMKFNETKTDYSKKISFLPRTEKELKRGWEALRAARKDDTHGVRRALKVSKNDAVKVSDSGKVLFNNWTVTSKAESVSFNKKPDARLADLKLTNSYMKAFSQTNFPELAELIAEGGVPLVLDLHAGGLSIPAIYSDNDFDDIRPQYYIEKIAVALHRGSGLSNSRSQYILDQFIKRHGDLIV